MTNPHEGETMEDFSDRREREMAEMLHTITHLPRGTPNSEVFARFTIPQWIDFQAYILISANGGSGIERITAMRIAGIVSYHLIHAFEQLQAQLTARS